MSPAEELDAASSPVAEGGAGETGDDPGVSEAVQDEGEPGEPDVAETGGEEADEAASAPSEEESFDVGATFRAHAMMHKLLEQLSSMDVETTDAATLVAARKGALRLYKALGQALPREMHRDLCKLAPKPSKGVVGLGELRVNLAIADGWLEEVLDQVRGAMAARVTEIAMEGGSSNPVQLMAHMAAQAAAAKAGGQVPGAAQAADSTGMYL